LGQVLEWIHALEGLRKRVGEEALDSEREREATRAVAAKGRSTSNSIFNNNAHSKVRSDG